jgi:drug/metabolite transporter (DMT)-like permease
MERQAGTNWLVFVLLCLVWGSSFILMKRSADYLSGWQIGSIRIFSAGLAFLPLAIFHIRQIPAQKIPLVILSGILGNLFPAFLFAIAIEKKIDSSLAGILNSLTPLLVVIIGLAFFKTSLRRNRIIGVAIGLVGLILLSVSKGTITVDNAWFTFLIFLATVCYGFNVNLVSHYLKDVEPIKMATVSLAAMALVAGGVAWYHHVFSMLQYDTASHLPILYAVILGVVGSGIATAFFYWLIRRAGGLFASLVTYGIPVVSIFWGIWDGEQVGAMQIACLGLILSGVYMANK